MGWREEGRKGRWSEEGRLRRREEGRLGRIERGRRNAKMNRGRKVGMLLKVGKESIREAGKGEGK